ncbi:serine/threonine-protein kinase svkA-like [Homarus americanus]|uniref:serine/threonine-protein kinase svkA-like n=1 Tax=Homarus americanus TaxID=6706 RepID=UPI001C43E5BB|nr:serine/threonine-protein kinase svkA-like [Homarus americanus]
MEADSCKLSNLIKFCEGKGIRLFQSSKEMRTIYKKGDKGEKIGSGTLGQCFRVSGDTTDYVIKICQGENIYAHIYDEIKHLEKVQDIPGTQKLVGAYLEKTLIMTEYAGEPLDQYINKHNLGLDKLESIILQLAKITEQMISRGLAHNDIKADNICIITKEDDVKVTLIDFGLGTKLGEKVYKSSIPLEKIRQLFWMAPEVVRGGKVSENSDIYSLAKLFNFIKGENKLPAHIKRWIADAENEDPDMRPTLERLISRITKNQNTNEKVPSLKRKQEPEKDTPSKKICK